MPSMSVLLEFTIDSDAFQLGRILSPPPGIVLELERIVPTGSVMMPFVWVIGEDYQQFEESVRSHPSINALTSLDRFGNQGLYRVEWDTLPRDLIAACEQSNAVILEAQGSDTWEFRLRFSDHENLETFHNAVSDQEISIRVDRSCTLPNPFEKEAASNLTQGQREALLLAVRRGYFESPNAVQLDGLAGELGISRQALSKRIRRGNKKKSREHLPFCRERK